MTSERSKAYGRVMKTLDDLGPSKLLPSESEGLRDAADVLLFCDDLTADPHAERALRETRALAHHLVQSGRWLAETVESLVRDMEATGPLSPVAAS